MNETTPKNAAPPKKEPRKPWSEAAVRELLEQVKGPFLQVVKKDGLQLVWARERDFAVEAIIKDDYFQKCSDYSIINAVKKLVYVGLSLNPVRQHVALIARYDKRAQRVEATAMVMYRGLMHLATEAGVHGLKGEVVYRDDKFTIGSGTDGDRYEHDINPLVERVDANFIGAYVAAKMPAGSLKVEWVPRKDIYKMRDQSDSYLDDNGKPRAKSPWVMWFDEMAKKSALKRAAKRWEEMIGNSDKWDRFIKAIALDNEQEGVIQPRPDDIDGEVARPAQLLLTQEQVTTLETLIPTPTFKRKICDAYGVKKLEEIPAEKYGEIDQRIKASKAEAEKRTATKGKKP